MIVTLFRFLWRRVDVKHLMHFESETSVSKFLLRGSGGALMLNASYFKYCIVFSFCSLNRHVSSSKVEPAVSDAPWLPLEESQPLQTGIHVYEYTFWFYLQCLTEIFNNLWSKIAPNLSPVVYRILYSRAQKLPISKASRIVQISDGYLLCINLVVIGQKLISLWIKLILYLVNRWDSSRHGGCDRQNETLVGESVYHDETCMFSNR